MAMTKRQKQVLDFIANYQVVNEGVCPSYEEIARGLHLSSIATVHKHISALESRKYLTRQDNKRRSLEIVPKVMQEQRRNRIQQSMEVPIRGTIAAGRPVEAIEDQDHATLSFSDYVGNKDTFALRVRGESMIDDHICEGDMILVEKLRDARETRDGEIVVALVGGDEATLKRFYREPGNIIRLQPANSAMSPIRVPAQDVEVQGRLLAVLRKY